MQLVVQRNEVEDRARFDSLDLALGDGFTLNMYDALSGSNNSAQTCCLARGSWSGRMSILSLAHDIRYLDQPRCCVFFFASRHCLRE